MSTQQTSVRRISRPVTAALVALVLTAAVLVVAIQASSIVSTGIDPQAAPVPSHSAPTTASELRTSRHLPEGCRPKFGCEESSTTSTNREHASRRLPKGCRPKFGCE